MLLGPAGVGLLGLYGAISDLTRSVAGMGLNSSGVRQIAEAVGTGDGARIARTVTVLRRLSLVLGTLGAALLVICSSYASAVTFGSSTRAGAIALLSLAVLFTLLSDGQAALIQGLRRIPDLARMRIWGALGGGVTGVVLVYFLRADGVVPAIVAAAAVSLVASWWYARTVSVSPPRLSLGAVVQDTTALLRIGSAFMASALMMTGVAYFVRLAVLRQLGYDAAGLYQSAWTLAGIYAGFILQAMGADFYPRLTAVASNHAACNQMVNEQALVSLLLAGPGVLATLTFAPTVMALFYSAEFVAAAEVLRWICLGITLRIVIWPIGYIILARGAAKLFFITELVWTVVHVVLVHIGLDAFGLAGAGIAFFGSYVVHGCLVYAIVRKLTGFRWSEENKKAGTLFLLSTGMVFCGFHVLGPVAGATLGTLACAASSYLSLRAILGLVAYSDRIPSCVRRILVRLRFLPAEQVATFDS